MTDPTIHVLLVEDNPIYARLISGLLSTGPSVKITWQQVEQLNSATDILRTEPFDIVLLDLSLPDSNGLDTFTSLYPHAICLPIIVLTSLKDEPLALQAVQAGAQDYFVKGQMDGELLVHMLRRAIEHKRTEISLQLKIYELMAAAHQLESAIRIGYQLNSSLGMILSRVEALLAQIPPDDFKHADLQTVQDEISRTGQLVANLLQFRLQNQSQVFKGVLPKLNSSDTDLLVTLSRREREILRLVAEGKTSREIADRLSLSPKTDDTYRSRLMRKIGVANLAALVKFAIQHGAISLE